MIFFLIKTCDPSIYTMNHRETVFIFMEHSIDLKIVVTIVGLQGMDYLSNLLLVVMFILLTWVAILIVCVLMALMITMVGFNMSWFTHSMNMLGLFIIPGVIVMISMQEILKATVFQVSLLYTLYNLIYKHTSQA